MKAERIHSLLPNEELIGTEVHIDTQQGPFSSPKLMMLLFFFLSVKDLDYGFSPLAVVLVKSEESSPKSE